VSLPISGWGDEEDAQQPAYGEPEYDASADPAMVALADRLSAWNQPAQAAGQQATPGEPDFATPEQYPLDPHTDPEVLDALLPTGPDLPNYQNASHPGHQTRLGSMLRILSGAAVGALAGRGANEQAIVQSHGMRSGGVGVGFMGGLQAGQALQNLQLKRQALRDASAYKQAQTDLLKAKSSAFPQQQADLAKYRAARTSYLGAQMAKLEAEADKLRKAPNDKFIHAYEGDGGQVRLIFQKPDGGTYEKQSDQDFYQKPEKAPGPPHYIHMHGPDGQYLVDPTDLSAHKIFSYPSTRKAPESYFRRASNWKNAEWQKVVNDSLLSDEEKANKLQAIEDHFGAVVQVGGGEYTPFDVRTGTSADGSAAPNPPSKGTKEIHYRIVNGQLVPE
jgi:hypothetical protein